VNFAPYAEYACQPNAGLYWLHPARELVSRLGMSVSSHEERFEEAPILGEMTALVEKFLAGAVSREELHNWAHSLRPTSHRGLFRRNGNADALYTCLWNLDQQLGSMGEALVRRDDIAEHLRDLRTGVRHIESEPIARLKLSIAEIARRSGVEDVRFPWEGLGWYERVRFASSGTGMGFIAMSPIDPPPRQPGVDIHLYRSAQVSADRAWVLDDLFDTLCIDAEDAVHCSGPPVNRWDLMRLDDNGHQLLVASFTGYAKARARLARYESTHHKQSYWLEQRLPRIPSGSI